MIIILNSDQPFSNHAAYDLDENSALLHHTRHFGLCDKIVFKSPSDDLRDMVFCRMISKKNLEKFLKKYCNL